MKEVSVLEGPHQEWASQSLQGVRGLLDTEQEWGSIFFGNPRKIEC